MKTTLKTISVLFLLCLALTPWFLRLAAVPVPSYLALEPTRYHATAVAELTRIMAEARSEPTSIVLSGQTGNPLPATSAPRAATPQLTLTPAPTRTLPPTSAPLKPPSAVTVPVATSAIIVPISTIEPTPSSSTVTVSVATPTIIVPTLTIEPTPLPIPPTATPTQQLQGGRFPFSVQVPITQPGVRLLYRPDGQPLSEEIPQGETVTVLGEDTGWYRVVRDRGSLNVDIGWLRMKETNQTQSGKFQPIPAPPKCADQLGTQAGLTTSWRFDGTLPAGSDVVAVVDLYRRAAPDQDASRSFTRFPSSKLELTVNGQAVENGVRSFGPSRAQFLLTGVPFRIMGGLKPADQVGFRLGNTGQEPLEFFVTFFAAPQRCDFN